MSVSACPCGSGKRFATCCEPYLQGAPAPTPEALMRSRYTAYTQANIDYIIKTMAGKAAIGFDKDAALLWTRTIDWLGLDIVASRTDGASGQVEFIAHYQDANGRQQLHEASEFSQQDGIWFYIDGEHPTHCSGHATAVTATKVGANDTCPCGSGKKFKKCCRKI